MPCKEETIRGFAKAQPHHHGRGRPRPRRPLSRRAADARRRPGRLFLLSTPYGKRGFFYDAWARGGDDWLRFEVPVTQVSRIDPSFLEDEKRAVGEAWYRQEYCCSFEALEGLVYPDFARCVVAELPEPVRRQDTSWHIAARPPSPAAPGGYRRVVGLDFGFRNPFAAVWASTIATTCCG